MNFSGPTTFALANKRIRTADENRRQVSFTFSVNISVSFTLNFCFMFFFFVFVFWFFNCYDVDFRKKKISKRCFVCSDCAIRHGGSRYIFFFFLENGRARRSPRAWTSPLRPCLFRRVQVLHRGMRARLLINRC